jgi:hypothetical protein
MKVLKQVIEVLSDPSTYPDLTEDKTAPTTVSELEEGWRQQRALDDLQAFKRLDANQIIHCELCDQLFVSFDIFHDHRQASPYRHADDDVEGWSAYRELEPGDPIPGSATVGHCEPCVPTNPTEPGPYLIWHYHAMLDVAERWNIPVDDAEEFLQSIGLFEEDVDV